MSSQEKLVVAGAALTAGVAAGLALARFLPKRPYVPARVWTPPPPKGRFGGMNQPTSGARSQKELPKGKHALQLYSLGTPNGVKVTAMLEELHDAIGLEYDAWKINIMQLDQFTSGFVAINPNSKIPALFDTDGPGGKPQRVFESASILLYLAEKYNRFIPTDKALRTECLNWVFWLQGSAPYIGGGFGHFYKYAPERMEYPIDRFSMETKRLLHVLDTHLSDGRSFICGEEITIADFCIYPWMRAPEFYGAVEFLQYESYTHLRAYIERMKARPACARGARVNGFSDDAIAERHSAADFSKL